MKEEADDGRMGARGGRGRERAANPGQVVPAAGGHGGGAGVEGHRVKLAFYVVAIGAILVAGTWFIVTHTTPSAAWSPQTPGHCTAADTWPPPNEFHAGTWLVEIFGNGTSRWCGG